MTKPKTDKYFKTFNDFFDWVYENWNLKDSDIKIEINNIIYDSPSEVLEAYKE